MSYFVIFNIVDDHHAVSYEKTNDRCSKPGSVTLISFPPFRFRSRISPLSRIRVSAPNLVRRLNTNYQLDVKIVDLKNTKRGN